MYKCDSGESDGHRITKKFIQEQDAILARKRADQKAPKNPKNPEKEYIKRQGRTPKA